MKFQSISLLSSPYLQYVVLVLYDLRLISCTTRVFYIHLMVSCVSPLIRTRFLGMALLLNSFVLPVLNQTLCSSSSTFLLRGATADPMPWIQSTSQPTASRPVASTARRVTCWRTATVGWCICQVGAWPPVLKNTSNRR